MSQDGIALTKDETALLARVLQNARLGKATVSELSEAYLLADKANLLATMIELRKFISVAASHKSPPLILTFVLGVTAGITANIILRKTGYVK